MLTTVPSKQSQTPSQSKKSEGFFFQPKLTINQPNDVYEQEADAVADKVMRMQETAPSLSNHKPFFSPPTVNINNANTAKEEPLKKENKEETEETLSEIQAKLSVDGLLLPSDDNKANDKTFIQRKCAHCEEEEKLQRKYLVPFIQKKESANNSIVNDAVSNQIHSTKGSGKPIHETTKSFMESRFGSDFSNVKIHTGNESVMMNRELNAKAFTVGNDIYFNEGQYNPNSDSGKHLLAHELVHTVQQGGEKKISKKKNLANNIESRSGNLTIQCSRLRDFNDADATHDPSNLDDATIRQTNEYKAYMNATLVWQMADHVTGAEALLACRLLLRDMRAGIPVDWESGGRRYLNQARMQLGTLTAAEGLENELSWVNEAPGLQNTDFGTWLLGGGAEPASSTSTMNCWEVVMYSAFVAGFTTKPRLAALYTTFQANIAGGNIPAAVTAFENAIRSGPEQVYDRNDPDSPKPLSGDLVIFNTLAAHVAVAIGRNSGTGEIEIMSLFNQNGRHVFRTTIEGMLDNRGGGSTVHGPVRFFSPKW